MRRVEACICINCGSMSWFEGEVLIRKWVDADGAVRSRRDVECSGVACSECGEEVAIIAVRGRKEAFRELAGLNPADRVLRALELISRCELEVASKDTAEDLIEYIETSDLAARPGTGGEEFLERAKEVLGLLKVVWGR